MEQDNRPIKVEFPSKMQVDSPDIQAIKKTSNAISKWIHTDLKKVIEPLEGLKRLPDFFSDLSKTIVNQFSNLFLGQVEGDVISRQANIKVLQKKIESTQKHIGQKEENMNKTIERVDNRYKKMGEQLNVEHESFMQKLDSHAYELLEKDYPKQIQDKFSKQSLPGIDFLKVHAELNVADRDMCIDQGFDEARNEVQAFLDNRQLFYNELDKLACNTIAEGNYAIPYCFIELENKVTGETKLECWFECELKTGTKNSELEELRGEMEAQVQLKDREHNTIKKIANELAPCLNQLNVVEKERFFSDVELNY